MAEQPSRVTASLEPFRKRARRLSLAGKRSLTRSREHRILPRKDVAAPILRWVAEGQLADFTKTIQSAHRTDEQASTRDRRRRIDGLAQIVRGQHRPV